MEFNPPSRRVYNSKLQVNRPKSLSCIISSLAAALRDSSYRAAEQLSSPAEQAGKVRACRGAACLPAPSWVSWAGGRADLRARAFGHTPQHPGSGQGAGHLRRCKWSGAASACTAVAAASRPKTLLTALGRVSKSEQGGRSAEAGLRWAQWCNWCC